MSLINNLFASGLTSNFAEELLITFLGAFLGYISAIIVEKKISKKRSKDFIYNIIIELINIKNSLEEKTVNSKSLDKDCKSVPSPFAHSVYTPIWDTIIQTGDIIGLKDEKYYDELISVYGAIKHWTRCEDWLSENYYKLSEEQISEKIREIVFVRNDIYSILSGKDAGNSKKGNHVYELIRKYK